MDYYQGVVTDYLRATRTRFVNTECLIQLKPGDTPEGGLHWYCDAVAIDLHDKTAYLCEISYSQTLASLVKRLEAWRSHWGEIRAALQKDCAIGDDWTVAPWVFVPNSRKSIVERRILQLGGGAPGMPAPQVTYLEDIAPWLYRSWNGIAYAAVEKVSIRTE